MSRNILIVAAHPDDEVLGCGGTIAKHVFDGDTVHVVFFTDGVGARPTEDAGATDADSRKMASVVALGILGVDEAPIQGFLLSRQCDGCRPPFGDRKIIGRLDLTNTT